MKTDSTDSISAPLTSEASFAGDGDNWTWEDLNISSGHAISMYKVYRSDNGPTGDFECVHTDSRPRWLGGDPDSPMDGDTYYYLITAVGTGGETIAGTWSDNSTLRIVDTASICP